MGCDIHLQVERRVDGKWEQVKVLPPRVCSWCDGRGHYKDRPDDKCWWCGERQKSAASPGMDCTPFHDRNYTVFAVLADVRNDGYVTPISQPRGIPEDCASPPRETSGDDDDEEDDSSDYGDHSFSWLTLAELQSYDWKQSINDEGWVDAPTFAAWEEAGAKGAPKSWCASVGGGGVEHVTHSRMREYIKDGMTEHPLIERVAGKRNFYTLIQWSVPLTDYCKTFLSFMETLAALGKPEDVRIVFGFDS